MYHGDRVPGFPQHPHRGFETITATIDGIIDHTDSKGYAGRYGQGDLQWMTAGEGIVHGEMFPLVNVDKPNPTKFFQIWLNLPSKNKMVPASFVMQWAEHIPRVHLDAQGAVSQAAQAAGTAITVWSGTLFGTTSLDSTPNSWAKDPSNEVGIFYAVLKPGARFTLPAAAAGAAINRAVYFLEGNALSVGGKALADHAYITLDAGVEAPLANTGTADVELLVLQGRPIAEPVAQHGPFVMNTRQEIQQAFADYQRTQFGGWPWDEDAVTFPADKGRFALQDGTETFPPSAAAE